MLKLNFILKLFAVLTLSFQLTSCDKPPGPGGSATIKGRVFASDFDNTQRYPISRGYSANERVFIIYGEGNIIGNDVRTGPDGTFEFRYLNKGKYRVFVNSLDTTLYFKGNDTEDPIIQNVEIKGTKETKTLPDFYINK